jgi:4-hydroxyphenylpyruvate dioxygenase
MADIKERGQGVPADFPIRRIDHLEFYVGNAKQAAVYYGSVFGFTTTAYRGLETVSRETASYLVEQGDIRLLLTTALCANHPIAKHVREHGDGVAIIALQVPDAAQAFHETVRRGAVPAIEPTEEKDENGVLRYSAIHCYGETLLKFVERDDYVGTFAPGFQARPHVQGIAGAGLTAIDHVVGNVELGGMERWVRFFEETMGFTQLVHFDDKAISTEYSALMSKVMQDGTGRIKFPINEPAKGRRKSQVQEYLDYYGGPGVQHIALATTDIVRTVSELKTRGVDFLRVPPTYYEDIEARVGKIDQPLDQLAALDIMIDRDDEGYLLQIFTQCVEDRPTLFFEIIERHGAKGFGEGNFKSLFEAIEREQARRGNLV